MRRVSGRFHGEVPAHLYFQRADQHLLARPRRRRDGPFVHHLYQRGEKRRRSVSRGRILGQYLAHRAGGVFGKRRVRHLQLQGGFGRGHGVRHAHRELRLAHHAHLPQLYHRRHAEQGECGRSHVGGPRWWRVGPGGGLPARADHAPAP